MGRFITFEGIEGSGKSTQIRLLADHLRDHRMEVCVTREPGGTTIGERIRAILLDPASHALLPRAELLLYSAARVQHVEQIIRPAIAAGKVVLCDRFTDATLAYQGGGRELPMDQVEALCSLAAAGLRPDLTLLLDLPVETGLTRARERNVALSADDASRFEEEDLAFHRRVRETYLALASSEADRFEIIAADGDAEQVAMRIRRVIGRFLQLDSVSE